MIGLAHAASFDRSTAGERLRQLARRGIIEKDATGRWRLTEEAEERAEDDVPVTMAAPEPDPAHNHDGSSRSLTMSDAKRPSSRA